MFISASITFALVIVVYNMWTFDNWIMHVVKTMSIFMLYIVVYTIFSMILKVEFAGELIGRIAKYVKSVF